MHSVVSLRWLAQQSQLHQQCVVLIVGVIAGLRQLPCATLLGSFPKSFWRRESPPSALVSIPAKFSIVLSVQISEVYADHP
jgi:hypothetical protein